MVEIKIKLGVCESCKHARWEWFDPSPPGVALSPGSMLVDVGCAREKELRKFEDWDNYDLLGQDENNQCPLWEPYDFTWCDRHKEWSQGEDCDRCFEEGVSKYMRLNL